MQAATALDDVDGDLPGSIVPVSTVNTSVLGSIYGDLQCK